MTALGAFALKSVCVGVGALVSMCVGTSFGTAVVVNVLSRVTHVELLESARNR